MVLPRLFQYGLCVGYDDRLRVMRLVAVCCKQYWRMCYHVIFLYPKNVTLFSYTLP